MMMKALFVALLVLALTAVAGPAAFAADEGGTFVDVDDNWVDYKVQGTGSENVVFVHCWTCDQTFWRNQVAALAGKYRTITMDLPGHGNSDKPEREYTQEYFVKSVAAVMDAAQVEKAVLVGHSMGASIVRLFAQTYPERVKALVIVDGALFDPPQDPTARQAWTKGMTDWANQFKGPDGEKKTVEFLQSMFSPATTPEVKNEVQTKMMATPRFVAESAMKGMINPDIWSRKPINVPVLAIYAASPNLNQAFKDFLAAIFPNLKYVEWTGVGHFYLLEVPDKLNKELADFLQGLK